MNLKIIFTKQEEDSYNLFINLLSKNEDFILKLSDKDFNCMIKNPYFKENIRIKIENLNKKLLSIKQKSYLYYIKNNINEFENIN